jgi:hypothetical protein
VSDLEDPDKTSEVDVSKVKSDNFDEVEKSLVDKPDSEDLEDDLEIDDLEVEEEEEPASNTGLKGKLSSMVSGFKKGKSKKKSDKVAEDDIEIEEDFEEETLSAGRETKGGVGVHLTDFKYKVEQTINQKVPALAKLLNKNKSKQGYDDASDDINEAGAAKKKFKLTPIQIVVVIALLIFLMDFGEDGKAPAPKNAKKALKKNKAIEKTEEAIVNKPFEEEEIIQAESEPEKPIDKIPEEEVITNTEKPKSELDELKQVDTPEPEAKPGEPEEEPIPENTELDDLTLDTEPQVDPPVEAEPTPEPEPLVPEAETEQAPGNSVGGIEGLEEEVSGNEEEIIPQENIKTNISTDITRKLLKDLEVRLKAEKRVQQTIEVLKPITAPSYETVGKGLVYNCSGKHWACIEANEYKKCRQNYSWNRSESIPIECYPVAFLETEFDCVTVQQEKIDSISETSFCE